MTLGIKYQEKTQCTWPDLNSNHDARGEPSLCVCVCEQNVCLYMQIWQ